MSEDAMANLEKSWATHDKYARDGIADVQASLRNFLGMRAKVRHIRDTPIHGEASILGRMQRSLLDCAHSAGIMEGLRRAWLDLDKEGTDD
jgi:hypothetical protein